MQIAEAWKAQEPYRRTLSTHASLIRGHGSMPWTSSEDPSVSSQTRDLTCAVNKPVYIHIRKARALPQIVVDGLPVQLECWTPLLSRTLQVHDVGSLERPLVDDVGTFHSVGIIVLGYRSYFASRCVRYVGVPPRVVGRRHVVVTVHDIVRIVSDSCLRVPVVLKAALRHIVVVIVYVLWSLVLKHNPTIEIWNDTAYVYYGPSLDVKMHGCSNIPIPLPLQDASNSNRNL